MGPRAEARGNPAQRGCRGGSKPSFNGAASRSPRKWPRWRAMPLGSTCFNGAASRSPRKSSLAAPIRRCPMRLQWGREPKPAEISATAESSATTPSFNGAASRSPRKCLGMTQLTAFELASMGPRAEARGNPERPTQRRAVQGASMGPRAEARGNHAAVARRYAARELQWGREPKPAEIFVLDDWSRHVDDASMGPRAEARGNPRERVQTLGRHLASMGPRAEARGNAHVRPGRHRPFPGFNGAASRSPRK